MKRSTGIYYFSGTGNTRILAELFQKELRKRKYRVDLYRIEDILNKKKKYQNYDITGIGYPIHAFNAPRIVFDFIKNLPRSDNKKVFLFKCPGDPLLQGGVTSKIRSRLKSKGYTVFHESLIVMPANVMIKFNDRFVKQLYDAAVRKIKTRVKEICRGKTRLQKNSAMARLITGVFSSLESLGSHFGARDFKVNKSCNMCGKCIKDCPTRNIYRKNNKIRFRLQCVLCLRCLYGCPRMAIRPRIFNSLVFKDGYNISKVINNKKIKGDFINRNTRGYFRHYYDYIKTV